VQREIFLLFLELSRLSMGKKNIKIFQSMEAIESALAHTGPITMSVSD
jgi:hypothetical protein